tara:strand:- start:657 stop:1025 length:369 start_codon:yes stop_codon:yes gene_type:complete
MSKKSEYAMTEEYNGWTNFETWNVALWIGSDEFLYKSFEPYKNLKNGFQWWRIDNRMEYGIDQDWRTPCDQVKNKDLEFPIELLELDAEVCEIHQLSTPDGICFYDNKLNIDALNETITELF